MLKKTITYVDFDGDKQTDEFYFNLTKTELTGMEMSANGGMSKMLKGIIGSNNTKQMFEFWKGIIVNSVGIKSEDGKKFVKGPEVALDFVSSAAFDVLFMELSTNTQKAIDFIKGIIPQELVGGLDEALSKSDLAGEVGLKSVPVDDSPSTSVESV